jgi:hypothetical protein
MKRRSLAGLLVLAAAAAVTSLTFAGLAGAKSTRMTTACAHPTKITPTHGGPGQVVTVYTKNSDLVTSMWMKHKGETFNPPTQLFNAQMKDLQHGNGWVSAKVPAGETPRIVDAPIEVDVYDGELCAVITPQTFKIEDYK